MEADRLDADISEHTASLTVDERVYSIEALLRTAYWFTDRAYIFISKPSEHTLQVNIRAKAPTLESPIQQLASELAGEFGNALLDNQLRESVEARTGKIRELLVMKALAEAAAPEEPPGSPNDPVAERQQTKLTQIIR